MQRLRSFFSICLALVLCASLCLCALSTAVFFAGGRQGAFSTAAMSEAVFETILSGEDPALVEDLENIPEFAAAQSRYVEQLAAYRYDGGAAWEGLTDEEASAIARSLLSENLTAQDPAYADREDFDRTLAELSRPLQNALQDVFPPFDYVMHGTLALKLDAAAALIRGSAAAASALVSLVSLALLLLVSPTKHCRNYTLGFAFAASAIFALLCGFSFLRDTLLLDFDTPLSLLADLPKNCATILFIFGGAYVVALVVVSLLESVVAVPIAQEKEEPVHEEPGGEVAAEETEESTADTFIAAPITQSQLDAAAEMEQAASGTTLEEIEALFVGASQYDADMEPAADSSMDDLLAQAAGPLFARADAADIPDVDPVDNAAYLEDLQSLFEGRVENGRAE